MMARKVMRPPTFPEGAGPAGAALHSLSETEIHAGRSDTVHWHSGSAYGPSSPSGTLVTTVSEKQPPSFPMVKCSGLTAATHEALALGHSPEFRQLAERAMTTVCVPVPSLVMLIGVPFGVADSLKVSSVSTRTVSYTHLTLPTKA